MLVLRAVKPSVSKAHTRKMENKSRRRQARGLDYYDNQMVDVLAERSLHPIELRAS